MAEEDPSPYARATYENKRVMRSILLYLDLEDCLKCRLICRRWKFIVDELNERMPLWRTSIHEEFIVMYKTAYYHPKPDLPWRNLYSSLCLWSRIHLSMKKPECEPPEDELPDFVLLDSGIINIYTPPRYLFYSIQEVKQTEIGVASGQILSYVENSDAMVIIKNDKDHEQYEHSYIMQKLPRPHFNRLGPITHYILNPDAIYYITLDEKIYRYEFQTEASTSTTPNHEPEIDGAMGSGSENKSDMSKHPPKLLAIPDKEVVLERTSHEQPNSLCALNQHKFLGNHMVWRQRFQWIYENAPFILPSAEREIIIMKMFKSTVLVGTHSSIFRINRGPLVNNKLANLRTGSVVANNFLQPNVSALALYLVYQTDVAAGENSHKVLIFIAKKDATFGPNIRGGM